MVEAFYSMGMGSSGSPFPVFEKAGKVISVSDVMSGGTKDITVYPLLNSPDAP